MIRYLLRRLLSGLFLLWAFVTVLYFVIQAALPGDFVSQYALDLTADQEKALRAQFGLDLPPWQSYLNWLSDLLHGDLGVSLTIFGEGTPVVDVLARTLPATLLVFGLGTALAFLIGQQLGRWAAWRGPGLLTNAVTFTSIALYTSFPPWIAFLLVYLLASRLGIGISLGGRLTGREPGMREADVMWKMLAGLAVVLALLALLQFLLRRQRRSIPTLLALVLLIAGWGLSWLVWGVVPLALEILRQAALPILAYALLYYGEIMLVMRTVMVDTLHEDYVFTAQAKGLADKTVRDRHAARNALLPVTSRLMISLPFLLTGMVMIEKVLNWQGVGTTLFYAVGMQNIPLAMGAWLVIGLLSLVTRLALDVLQVSLDPRLR